MAEQPRETYTDSWTDEVLVASTRVADRALEMTPGISPHLEAAFKALAEAVYQWTEQLDLLDELEGEGVRAGSVADVAGVTQGPTYTASVERVLSAAQAVCMRASLEEGAISLSGYAPPPCRDLLHDLENAYRWWERRGDVAAEAWEKGLRPTLVGPAASATPPTPHPPHAPPPGTSSHASAPSESERVNPQVLAHARPRDDGGDSAAHWRAGRDAGWPEEGGVAQLRRPDADPCEGGIGPPPPMDEDEDDEETGLAAYEALEQAREWGPCLR